MLENIDDSIFVELDERPEDEKSFPHLRYDRQKRLENAPNEVKLLHSPDYIKRQSMFSCIWSNKGHRFIFIAIILLASLNLGIYFYDYSARSAHLNGVKIELKSFEYEGSILVNVVFLENKKIKSSPLEMNVMLKAFNKEGEEAYESKASGIYIGSTLMLHFKIEEKNIKNIKAIIENNGKMLSLSSKV